MFVVYKTREGYEGVHINDDDDTLEELLDTNRLPFNKGDRYRVLTDDMPLWPLADWAGHFIETGKLPDLGDYTPEVPLRAITARQLRLALSKNNFLSQVEPALKAIPNDQAKEEALIEWEYATEYQPNHALVYIMIAEFGLTSKQFRTMWLAAMAL